MSQEEIPRMARPIGRYWTYLGRRYVQIEHLQLLLVLQPTRVFFSQPGCFCTNGKTFTATELKIRGVANRFDLQPHALAAQNGQPLKGWPFATGRMDLFPVIC